MKLILLTAMLASGLTLFVSCKTTDDHAALQSQSTSGLAEGASCGGGIVGALKCREGLVCAGAKDNVPGKCEKELLGLAEGASCGGGIVGALKCREGLVCAGAKDNVPGKCEKELPGLAEGASCGGGIIGGIPCKAGLTCKGAKNNIPGSCQKDKTLAKTCKPVHSEMPCSYGTTAAGCPDGQQRCLKATEPHR